MKNLNLGLKSSESSVKSKSEINAKSLSLKSQINPKKYIFSQCDNEKSFLNNQKDCSNYEKLSLIITDLNNSQ